jgi:NAD(P)-dependent dehydrogenase (short-subunit alcohol dehydrogenase family)
MTIRSSSGSCPARSRWAEPGDLAAAALLLADPLASYLTGAVLPVDGGWTATEPDHAQSPATTNARRPV